MVRQGSPRDVARAVESYGKLYPAPIPQPCTVEINRSPQGFIGLRFLNRIPTYSFLNLIGWLNQPPDITGVFGALGWCTSPATQIKYALYPDPTNDWGDTLIGYNRQNQAVSVYLPEASLCEISSRVTIHQEPVLEQSRFEEKIQVKVVFNADPHSGNFNFVTTHPKDHKWG